MAADRDLLVLEPNLFRDVGWVGQRLSRGTGTVAGTTLTIASPEVALDTANVTAGHVVVVAGVSYEVVARVSATELTISRLRDSTGAAANPPTAIAAAECSIVTFGPQIAMAHAEVVRLAGLETADEAKVVNEPGVVRLEALGALAIIWAAASGLLGSSSPGHQRAEWYRERFVRERERVGIRVDLDGDGVADDVRGLSSGRMRRGCCAEWVVGGGGEGVGGWVTPPLPPPSGRGSCDADAGASGGEVWGDHH